MGRLYREPHWMVLMLRGERLFWSLFAVVAVGTIVAVIWLLK